MTKLLNRPLKAFAFYALVILLISVPVYVLVVDHIWISELDENNWLTLQHTKERLETGVFTREDLEQINHIWGELLPGVSITKTNEAAIRPDSVYEILRPHEYDTDDGAGRFRGLVSYLNINEQPYQITIETNVEEADETLLAIAIVTFFFFILLIVGFILLNRRISARSWRPFYQTLHSLQSFDLNKDDNLHLPPTDIQEFQELNQSLHLLVKNNIAAYQQQKTFTENASHELQTPIALLKSKLDLLLQEKEITPEIAEILSGIEAPLSRLSRINKNLLLLAKVENQQYSDKEQLDIKEYVGAALILFEDYLNNKNLFVRNCIQDSILINTNSFLLETLLHNLLSNAIRHTSDGGQIRIELQNRTIFIANSGKQALDEKHLFDRFSSTSKDKISSGLGLAIIKEIVLKNNWQVRYHFDNGFHTFAVSF